MKKLLIIAVIALATAAYSQPISSVTLGSSTTHVVLHDSSDVREQWQEFYEAYFDLDVDFSAVIIPNRPSEKYRLIIVAKGLTLNMVFDAWPFKKWRYNEDLDKAILISKRTTQNAYAVWVLDQVERDQEFLGQSPAHADPTMEIGMTLLERMIFELKYFTETGKHLDVKGITLCTGSRFADGNDVPCVYWFPFNQEVVVSWYHLADSDGKDGLRRAIALDQ